MDNAEKSRQGLASVLRVSSIFFFFYAIIFFLHSTLSGSMKEIFESFLLFGLGIFLFIFSFFLVRFVGGEALSWGRSLGMAIVSWIVCIASFLFLLLIKGKFFLPGQDIFAEIAVMSVVIAPIPAVVIYQVLKTDLKSSAKTILTLLIVSIFIFVTFLLI